MATYFQNLGTRQTTDVFGANLVRDVMASTIQTKPTGIVYEIRIARDEFSVAYLNTLAEYWSELLESAVKHSEIMAIEWYQDVDAANQLHDLLSIIVGSTSGRSSTILTQPFGDILEWQFLGPLVQAAQAELDAAEAL